MSNFTENDHKNNLYQSLLQKFSNRRSLYWLAGFSILFILLAVIGVSVYLSRKAETKSMLKPPPSIEELAEQFPKLSRILRDDKLDSVYKQFLMAYQKGGEKEAYEMAKKRGILNSDNEVKITLELDTTDTASLERSLEEHGIKVTAAAGNLIDIAIPVSVLQASLESDEPGAVFMDISDLEHIVKIRLPLPAMEDYGYVETEGTAVIGSDVWNEAGITGMGIKIGVLDIGFDGYKELLGSDLPEHVTARSFTTGKEIDQIGTVHGAAVSEIIYDIAPDAELFFASYKTVAEKQSAVDWLISNNVDIITSSTSTTYGRRDGKSAVAQMVDMVFSQGILWVNSAGNTGYSHYRGMFTDTNGNGYHEFAPGDEYLGFTPYGSGTLSLNWDDWDLGIQDFDMYLVDDDGNELASSTDTQSGVGSDSGEFIYYEFPDKGPYYVVIYGARYDRAVTFDLFLRDGELEYYTPEYSLNTPADAYGSLTVGAAAWDSDELSDYSSRGPSDDGRLKPEIVAPSGVSSAAYGESWIGTSASCPHVTGAAALVMQAFPDFTVQQVRDFLYERAIDMDVPGPDSNTGFGALYLGDPPNISQIQPVPVPSVEAPPPQPTNVAIVIPTAVGPPTATPALEKKPQSENDKNLFVIPLFFFGCVVLPGIIGLGGFALIGAVLYNRRAKREVQAPEQDRRYWDVPDGEVFMPPQQPMYPVEQPLIPIICPNCGKENKPGMNFCTSCGTDLSARDEPAKDKKRFCAKCGNPLSSNAKFCPKCGEQVK